MPKKNWFMFGEAFDGDDSLLASSRTKKRSTGLLLRSFRSTPMSWKCGAPTKKIESLWNDRLRFDPATAHLHAANRSDRFARSMARRFPTRTAGLPICCNQQGSALGPSDDTGKPIPPSQLLVSFDNHDVARYACPSIPASPPPRALVASCTTRWA